MGGAKISDKRKILIIEKLLDKVDQPAHRGGGMAYTFCKARAAAWQLLLREDKMWRWAHPRRY
jgi:3-phosphoglycerate kinase